MTNLSQCSPRLVTSQPIRPEDDRNFIKMLSSIFKERENQPTEEALLIMNEMQISVKDI